MGTIEVREKERLSVILNDGDGEVLQDTGLTQETPDGVLLIHLSRRRTSRAEIDVTLNVGMPATQAFIDAIAKRKPGEGVIVQISMPEMDFAKLLTDLGYTLMRGR